DYYCSAWDSSLSIHVF
nr:immunoglobulin light chain junction region [Macaca mulatta]MOW04525.1 immunoglobulin light chain junction region [Macaca mulatta]MOW04687.1 immunoglobulin light chain junction region [Macaca mulatta]MOW04736.1 immunoglobulin light chain junction region [Macaca mulatta]MOW04741.1 immunoglobulin light chain junction region [Macaca mulatta]